MNRLLPFLAGALIAAILGVVAAYAQNKPTVPPNAILGGLDGAFYMKPERCPAAQKAIGFYRQKYRAHREAMNLPGPVPRVWYACDAARRRADNWRFKAKEAFFALKAWTKYHYDWQSWLPANWYVVGRCETGYGGAPNWNHANSSFVSAFGISRSIYDFDARLAGTPPWNDSNPPTPREQLLTAQAHYNHFGDGWTCPGP